MARYEGHGICDFDHMISQMSAHRLVCSNLQTGWARHEAHQKASKVHLKGIYLYPESFHQDMFMVYYYLLFMVDHIFFRPTSGKRDSMIRVVWELLFTSS